MYQLPDDALGVLLDSRSVGAGSPWFVTARYLGAQTVPSDRFPDYERVPVSPDGQFSFDASGQVQASGSLFVASDGASLVPTSMDAPLAPFGQELQIDYVVSRGGSSWRVPMGVYRISEVPSWDETFRRYPLMRVRSGWSVQVDFVDRFDVIRAAQFLGPASPSLGSVLVEAGRLAAEAGVTTSWPPVVEDATIPSSVTYQSDRLDAISQLLAAVNCDPAMTRFGALTAVPRDRWIGATRDDADVEMDGVVSFSGGMSGAVYNAVVFSNSQSSVPPGVATITDDSNPLSVNRLGLRVYTASSPLMDTAAKLQLAAETTLARVSQQGAQTIKVVGLPRPDVDLGDVVWVRDNLSGREAVGQLSSFDTGGFDPTGQWTYSLTGVELL